MPIEYNLNHNSGQIPVTTTLMGMGAFDELNPLSLHMLGMHGSAYANYAMQSVSLFLLFHFCLLIYSVFLLYLSINPIQADCIIGLGARFDDRVTGTKINKPACGTEQNLTKPNNHNSFTR